MEMDHKPNFTPRAQRAIEIAKKAAKDMGSKAVSLEHLFLGVLHLKAGVIHEVLLGVGISPAHLITSISDRIREQSVKNRLGPAPEFDPKFKQVLEISSLISKNFGHDYVGIEHMLLAMLKYDGSPINEYFKLLGIPEDLIIEQIKNYFQLEVSESPSTGGFHPFAAAPPDRAETARPSKPRRQATLEKYGVNYVQKALDDKFDDIIGKESEILEVCEILCRRIKNNPVLLGEPGVGKTAIVEGLAQSIARGSAPEHLLDKQIYGIDLPSMIAGTKYRGQFEERLKGLLEEAKSDDKVILFIDELHTLVGAGSAEGTMDAANILKPLLSKGDIRCIGATTNNEYKKSILKDGALDRRFQPVTCRQPTEKETLEILKGVKHKYEEFHYVEYDQECLQLIVNLAARYIPSRQFPDKALDILDQVGAKVKIRSFVRPKKSRTLESQLEELTVEEDVLRGQGMDCSDVNRRQEEILEKYSKSLQVWAKKNFKSRKPIKDRDIYKTLSQLTNVPMTELSKTDAQRFLNLEDKVKSKVIGQDNAVSTICKAILRSKSGLRNESKPVGSFLLLGQTGLGKTHTAKSIAASLFGNSSEIITIDMSEYSEKISSTRLSGAAPGYVGYEEGSPLIDKITKNPYSVVLFDEIEKAHPDVLQSLLQVLEEGRLTDGLGRVGDFTNSIIILTGNIGSEISNQGGSVGFNVAEDQHTIIVDKITEKANQILRPEFVNRITEVIVFNSFTKDDFSKILNVELQPLRKKLKDKDVSLRISKSLRDSIIEKAQSLKYGARPIARIIQKEIEDVLAELLINKKLNSGERISFSGEIGKAAYSITAKSASEDPGPPLA